MFFWSFKNSIFKRSKLSIFFLLSSLPFPSISSKYMYIFLLYIYKQTEKVGECVCTMVSGCNFVMTLFGDETKINSMIYSVQQHER